METIAIYDRPSVVEVEDTEGFDVSLKVNGSEVVMPPAYALRVAGALRDAAQEAEENLALSLADSLVRGTAGDAEAVSFAQLDASVEAGNAADGFTDGAVTPDMRLYGRGEGVPGSDAAQAHTEGEA